MLVQRKLSDDPSVSEYRPRWTSALARRADRWALRRYLTEEDFSPAVLRRPVHRQINALRPEVVNLHWVNDGFLSPESIGRIHAPLIWTLRDLWPLTGGCHYTQGCERFTRSCGACPQLHSDDPQDLSRRVFLRKAAAWRALPLSFVALSSWVAAEVRRSALFAGREVSVIPNSLDTGVFRPQPRQAARAALGLASAKRLILFVALNPLEDARKGFSHLVQAAGLLARRPDAERLELLVVGETYQLPRPSVPFPVRYLGAVHDDARLATLYAAADVTVMPSLEEAFGKVALESLACGTPVAGYRGTGLSDIVEHARQGHLAELGDSGALAQSVAWVLDHPEPEHLAAQAVARVLGHFTHDHQARAYEQLYARTLEVWHSQADNQAGGGR